MLNVRNHGKIHLHGIRVNHITKSDINSDWNSSPVKICDKICKEEDFPATTYWVETLIINRLGRGEQVETMASLLTAVL